LDFFNSFRFYFTPSLSTPQATRLKVVLKLSTSATASTLFLEGSISENLPRFNSDPVVCFIDKTTLNAYNLVCENVGVLNAEGLYHVSIKIGFPY
jgi:hypothetical protein